MSDGQPQNPAFEVSPDSVEACAPKVLCPACGTVIAVRARRIAFRRRCQACATMLDYQLEGSSWRVVAENAVPS